MYRCKRGISFLKHVLLLFVVLQSAIVLHAQSIECAILGKEPTCPNPSNASIMFKLTTDGTVEGTYDLIISSVFEHNKEICNVSVDMELGKTEYVYSVENLDYQYYDPDNGELKTHIQYLAYITDGSQIVSIKTFSFNKPEYSALTKMIRGSGCDSQPVGKASVSFVLGVPPYSWEWHKIGTPSFPTHANQEKVEDLGPGRYYTVVTDMEGCEINSDTVEIKNVDVAVSAKVIKHIQCKGEKTGEISATITNAYEDACTISWNDESLETVSCDTRGNASATKDGFAAKTLFVAVEDEIGCRDTSTITILEPKEKFTLELVDSKDLNCKDIPTGVATYTVLNAVGTTTYTWSDGGSGRSRSNLSANTEYKVVATDDNGCRDSATITLSQPDTDVKLSLVSAKRPSCYGASDGKIKVSASGGSSHVYTYTWNGVVGTSTNNTLSAGVCNIAVVDQNGCYAELTHELTQPTKIASAFIFTENSQPADEYLSCNGDELTVAVNVTGGVLPIKYFKWNGGAESSNSQITVGAGPCKVVMEDTNGCLDSVETVIHEPEKLTVTIAETSSIPCDGEYGELTANVTGGTGAYTYAWSNAATTAKTGQITEGTYSVTVTDENQCSASAEYTIIKPALLNARIIMSKEACRTLSAGTLTVEVLDGTAPYTYLWSTGSTEEMISGLKAHEYSITIHDASGCTFNDNIDLSNVGKYRIKTSATREKCPGSADGTATVKISYGFSPYDVKWYDKDDQFIDDSTTIENLAVGTYKVNVVDDRGCELNEKITVSTTTPMYVKSLVVTETQCVEPTGTATVALSKGLPPYTTLWSNGDTKPMADSLAEGKYTLRVTDANGCILDTSVTITTRNTLQVATLSSDTVIRCVGGTQGEAQAVASLGTAPYSFAWSNGATGETASSLTAGSYTVTVTDAEGCEATSSIRFVEKDVLTILQNDIHHVTCNGGNDGHIVVGVEGGVAPYTITWSNGASSYSNTNLTAGNYTVTVTDSKGCSVSKTFTITEPDDFVLSFENVSSIQCKGLCNATATVNIVGGEAPYTYNWSSGEKTQTASQLCVGTQSVEITDNKGCSGTKSLEIAGRDERLMVTNVTSTQPVCSEVTPSGVLSVEVAGSLTGSYTYEWKDNATVIGTGSSVSGLHAGAYTLTLSDGTCSFDTTIALSHQMTATASFEHQYSDCDGEAYKVIPSNESTANYTYLWSNGQTTQIAKGLRTGTYSVVATDDENCVLTASVTVEETERKVVLVSKTDANCFETATGSASVTTENTVGTVTYKWLNSEKTVVASAATAKNLSKGTYYAIAHDATHEDCPDTLQVSIDEPKQIQLYFSEERPSYCHLPNGAVSVDVVGAQGELSYSWEVADAVVGTARICNIVPSDENITVTVTDEVNCKISGTTQISDVSNFSLFGMQSKVEDCVGSATAELKIYTQNGYEPFTYSWSHNAGLNSPVASNLKKGSYSVSVTDDRGCMVTYDFPKIVDPDTIKVEINESAPIICNGGTGNMLAVVDGGKSPYTYEWYSSEDVLLQSSPNPELADKSKGTYKVRIIDGFACVSDFASYTLVEPDVLESRFSVKLTECGSNSEVGEITIDTVIGGSPEDSYRFKWGQVTDIGRWTTYDLEDKATLANLAAGEYICTITSARAPEDCYITDTLYTYPIMPDSIVTVRKHAHCNAYTDDDIQNKTPDGSIEVVNVYTNTADKGASERVMEDAANFTYLWNDSNAQQTVKAENLVAGVYSVQVTASNQCSATFVIDSIGAYVNLAAAISPVDDNTPDRKVICLEDSLQMESTLSTTYSYEYVPVDNVVRYYWSSTESNSLASINTPEERTTWVNPLTKYYADSTQIDFYYMIDGCKSPVVHYEISHFDSLSFGLEFYDTVGVYIGADSILAYQNTRYVLLPTEEPWFVNKASEDGILSISWSSSKKDSQEQGALKDTVTDEKSYIISGRYGLLFNATESNYIYAEATSTQGCKERAVVYLDVQSSVLVPSGFSPNGDNVNDTWIIPYLENCPEAKVKVFNRWGVKVFECNSDYYKNPWDGTSASGKDLPMGTYYYVIEFNDEKDTPMTTGSISILR